MNHDVRSCLSMALAALTLALAGCSPGSDTAVIHVYDAYEGSAPYPNKRPAHVLPTGPMGLTSDNGSDSITLVDLTLNQTVTSFPIGRDPIDNDGPHHLAYDRAAGVVYVALAYPAPVLAPGPHAAHGSSTRAGYVQKLAISEDGADLRPLGEVRVESNPGDIVLSEDGARLVVSHFDLQRALDPKRPIEERRATLALIDPLTIGSASPSRELITTCVAPHGVSLSRPSGDVAYVACYGEDALAIVDLASLTVTRVPVGPSPGDPGSPSYGPYSVVASPDGDSLAIGSTESRDVRLFHPSLAAMDPLVYKTQGAPYFAAWSADGATLYVPTQAPDAIVAFDVGTGDKLVTRSFIADECVSPHEVMIHPSGSPLYLVCEGDHLSPGHVLAIDPATLTTTATMGVGVYPDRLSIGVLP